MSADDPGRRQDLGLALLPFELEPEAAVHSCRNGWLPDDADGCAVPCLRCKPHLRRERRDSGKMSWRALR